LGQFFKIENRSLFFTHTLGDKIHYPQKSRRKMPSSNSYIHLSTTF